MKSRSLSQPAWRSSWPSSPSSPRPSSPQSLAMDLLRYLSTFKTKDRGNVQALLWRFCPKRGRCTSHFHTFPAISGKGFFCFVFLYVLHGVKLGGEKQKLDLQRKESRERGKRQLLIEGLHFPLMSYPAR